MLGVLKSIRGEIADAGYNTLVAELLGPLVKLVKLLSGVTPLG